MGDFLEKLEKNLLADLEKEFPGLMDKDVSAENSDLGNDISFEFVRSENTKTPEEIAREEKLHKEIYEAVIKEFTESGYFKPEILAQICDKVKNSVCSNRGFYEVFSYTDLLKLEEKKKLGLPTRKKISREMINSLSEKGLELPDPKETIEGIYYHHSFDIERKYALKELNETKEFNFEKSSYLVRDIDDIKHIFSIKSLLQNP